MTHNRLSLVLQGLRKSVIMVHDVFHLITKFIQYVFDIVRARFDHASYIAYDGGGFRAFTDKVKHTAAVVAASYISKTVLSVYSLLKSFRRSREIATRV